MDVKVKVNWKKKVENKSKSKSESEFESESKSEYQSNRECASKEEEATLISQHKQNTCFKAQLKTGNATKNRCNKKPIE